jgi:hypothetical protein
MSDSQLFADIRQLVREWLCISAEADPEPVAQRVAASVYAQDYHIDNDTIRNLRTRSVDVLWKLASRDVDSVKQAVCCHNTAHQSQSPVHMESCHALNFEMRRSLRRFAQHTLKSCPYSG